MTRAPCDHGVPGGSLASARATAGVWHPGDEMSQIFHFDAWQEGSGRLRTPARPHNVSWFEGTEVLPTQRFDRDTTWVTPRLVDESPGVRARRRQEPMMTLLEVAELAGREQYLAVVATVRADSTIQASVVNAGTLANPFDGGKEVLGFVTYGRSKLSNLRVRSQVTLTYRSGWSWASVEGVAELIGPDDPKEGVDGERLRLLLREVFVAAGGHHDDWDAYDAEMAEQRRTVVLVTPTRLYSNRASA